MCNDTRKVGESNTRSCFLCKVRNEGGRTLPYAELSCLADHKVKQTCAKKHLVDVTRHSFVTASLIAAFSRILSPAS